jgi:uncharacterized damage-inducible protein DinB
MFLSLAVLMMAAAAADAPQTAASVIDKQISGVEKEVIDAAEAMPAEKFDFTPEKLQIAGSDFKGVRSFAVQVRHIAASNYAIWSPLTGEKIPDDWRGGDGPKAFTTKAQIIQFLKDSFALGHKAAATLTAENLLEVPPGAKSPRLRLATFAVAHCFDHYGQIAEYLRMNGIVPPASRNSN